jgi:multiple sugar transport system substrate-binding protein
MLEGPWLLGFFPREQWKSLEQQIGFIPVFPVPYKSNQSATMMGGWELSIAKTSQNKDLAWELISIMVEPNIIAPMIKQYGYIPTQKSIGEGVFSSQLKQTIPYYDQMVSMISIGRSRPSTPEYPQIADHIKQAIDEVYYGMKEPKQALDDAARKSAKVLGW